MSMVIWVVQKSDARNEFPEITPKKYSDERKYNVFLTRSDT